MKRLFIAIPTSDEIHQLVNKISLDLSVLKNSIRFVKPENVHITLKFLGETEESLVPGIVEAIRSVSSSVEPFVWQCEGTGVFPGMNKPRLLWIGISLGVEQIKRLGSIIDDALFKTGISKEEKNFTAHLTIGRVKYNKIENDRLKDFLAYSFFPIQQISDRLVLFKSELSLHGSVYTPIETFIFRK